MSLSSPAPSRGAGLRPSWRAIAGGLALLLAAVWLVARGGLAGPSSWPFWLRSVSALAASSAGSTRHASWRLPCRSAWPSGCSPRRPMPGCASGRRRPPGTRPCRSRRSAAAWRSACCSAAACHRWCARPRRCAGARPRPSFVLPYLFTSLFLLSSAHLLADLGRAVGIGRWFGWYGEATFGRIVLLFLFNEIVHRRWRLADGRPLDPQLAAARAAAAQRASFASLTPQARELRRRRGRGALPYPAAAGRAGHRGGGAGRALGADLPADRRGARRDARPPPDLRRPASGIGARARSRAASTASCSCCWCSSPPAIVDTPAAVVGPVGRRRWCRRRWRARCSIRWAGRSSRASTAARRSSTGCAPMPPSRSATGAGSWSAAASASR